MIYMLVLLGTMFEGEFTLLLAAYLFHRGALDLDMLAVAFCGGLGAFLGDALFFEIGRRRGERLIDRWPWLRKKMPTIARYLARFPLLTVMVLRTQIGFRMVGNICLGQSEIERDRYLVWNAVACTAWVAVVIPLCLTFANFIDILLEIWQA